MKLNEYKCKNCGAKLKVDKEKKEAICEFCNTTYDIETLEQDGYEFEKGRIRAHKEENKELNDMTKKIFKTVGASFVVSKIIFIVVFVMILGVFIFIATKGISSFKKIDNEIEEQEEIVEEQEDTVEEIVKTYKKDYRFSSYEGKNSGFFLENLIEKVISNNKDDSEVEVIVTYKDNSYKSEEELKVLLKEFANNHNKDYYVSYEYDDNKQVNKINIEDF